MKIKFLKLLWLLFIVPVVGGMVSDKNSNKRYQNFSEIKKEAQVRKKYGVVKHSLGNCPNLINVVKQILGVDISSKEEAEFLIMNIFRFFGHVNDDTEGIEGKLRRTNLIIYDGQIYINGGTNVTRLFDNFPLYNTKGNLLKRYKVTQLSDILELDTKKLEAVRNVNNIYPKLKEWLYGDELDDKTKFSIECLWSKMKDEKDDQLIWDALDDIHHSEYLKNPETYDLMTFVAEYIVALHTLKVDTAHLSCDKKGLLATFWKSRNAVREQTDEFLEKFGKYIGELNSKDGKSFKKALNKTRKFGTKKYLNKAKSLWMDSRYNKYIHTEHMIQYQRKRSGTEGTPLYMISFLDPCEFCEKMLAENTSGYKTIVISGCKYHGSRSSNINQKRKNLKFVNRDVSLLQLDSDSYWKDKFELWRPCIEKQMEIINRLLSKREELI